MNKYKIEQILSKGKKGKLMVSVRVGTKTVTRHIVNGTGRHPDDTVPALHARHAKRVAGLRADVAGLTRQIEDLEKAVAGDGHAVFIKAAKVSLVLNKELRNDIELQLEAALRVQTQELEDNPLMVSFYVD